LVFPVAGRNSNVTGQRTAIRSEKSAIDLLETNRTSLPKNQEPTVWEKAYRSILLFTLGVLVDPSRPSNWRTIFPDSDRCNPQAFTVNGRILPHDPTTATLKGDRRVYLVSRDAASKRKLQPHRLKPASCSIDSRPPDCEAGQKPGC
jgi:hypothetical protein